MACLTIAALLLAVAACGGGDGVSSEVARADCASCHPIEAAAFEHASSHQILFDCEACHAERSRSPGPGHRAVPPCDGCHSEAGHPPPYAPSGGAGDEGSPATCAVCHDPHGSANLLLIRELVRLPEGTSASVTFQDLSGRADWSYAELPAGAGGRNAREPGEGLCEVCHTRTRFYDRYGTGEQHAQARCVRCHDHAQGFVPRRAGGAAQ